jgi:uroporphyrinogen decarboxylase
MRQAGRYMREYRDLRERYTILEMIRTPELACEVTLQPIKAFDLDAAIIFADILPPLAAMGLELDFVSGEGPVIYNPIRCAADVDRLHVAPPQECLAFTLDAIGLARAELGATPLIGFSGAPYTLACYAIDGGGSTTHLQTKLLMWREPELWQRLMSKLAEMVGGYLLAQAQAGAQALQLFDSWAGDLSAADYAANVLPYSRRALEIAAQSGVPIIHFSTGTSGMLAKVAEAGGDVIGVDWRSDLGSAWAKIGNRAIQGNLDPALLLAPWEQVQTQAQQVLDQTAGRAGHIFNLGHGVLPETPIDTVRRLVDFVHEATCRA